MILGQQQIFRMISTAFLVSPVVMLIFLARFIYIDRELYFTPAEIIRVVTLMPFLVALPYWGWTLYLKVRFLDVNKQKKS